MPKAARDVPPPLELLCLKALWSLQEGNVRDVQQIVADDRTLAYTTIMTVLERLVRKGKLTRRKTGRTFMYTPTQSRDHVRRLALREFLDGYFDGSDEALIQFLRSSAPLANAAAASAGVSAPQLSQTTETTLK